MSSVSTVGSTASASGNKPSGFAALGGEEFIKIMIAQLQQQDPLEPAKSDELLSQLSQIRAMEANETLTSSLQGLSLQQSIASGANLIGKTIMGINAEGDSITGAVTSVRVENKQVYLELDTGQRLKLESVTAIAPGSAAAV